MKGPLDYTQVIIKFARKMKTDGTMRSSILHSNGKQMGIVALSKRSFFVRLMHHINIKKFIGVLPYFGFKFEVTLLDNENKTLMKFTKPFTISEFKAAILDPAGRQLASLKQVPPDANIDLSNKKTQYNLTDYKNNHIAAFVGDWSSWNMQIFDDKNKTIGKLHKGHSGINKVVHGSGDFYVGEIYEGKIDKKTLNLIMGTCCAMNVIANE